VNMIATLLILLAAYLACGFVFAIPFVLTGVKRIDPHAVHGSWGFRILIFPGTIFLWPLLARRWFSGASELPEQNDPHRRAVRVSLSPQRGEGWECAGAHRKVEGVGQHHPSPSIPLPVEGRGKDEVARSVQSNASRP